jgi:hypothetical protein
MLGIVVNEKPNIPRHIYRLYRSIMHNCLRHGFEANATMYGWNDADGDFVEHLRGKLSYFQSINPDKAAALRTVFDQAVATHYPDRMPNDHVPPAGL